MRNNALWCNGNTQDFGSWISGSNLLRATIIHTGF
uniref:Uncharacterized protein n=1 Tax=Geladintestivirus 3 TaxID=3233135 RepID=A0AAU8MH09_9CAUD